VAIAAMRQKHLTGRDLAAERVRLSLRALDVAVRMGVSRQRVTNIEQLHRVPEELADRYLGVLKKS
jgi:DNA-binding transcriptional regulator YiaG